MFHLVMACMFFYRHCSRLKIYVSLLMLTIVAQYVKDLIFIGNTYYIRVLRNSMRRASTCSRCPCTPLCS